MNKLYLFLLWALPLKSFCQSENSPDSIWKKFVLLYQQGKLDSMNVPITHFQDYYKIIESGKQFYTRKDTFCFENGYYAIGRSIIDYYVYYNRKRVGFWTYYYPSGKRYAYGEFLVGAWTVCQAGGPNPVSYDYKTGNWKYWNEKGGLMASGVYNPIKEETKTGCGSDTVVNALVSAQWTFYDYSGNKRPFQPDLAQQINQCY